jgi:hypothetical protein
MAGLLERVCVSTSCRLWRRQLRQLTLGAAVGMVLAGALGYTELGRDLQQSLFTGRQLVARPQILNLGEVKSGDQVCCGFKLRNVGLRSLWVLGVQVDCACILTSDLPVQLRPLESRDVTLAVRVPVVTHSQEADHLVRVLPNVDDANGPLIRIRFRMIPQEMAPVSR